MKGKLLDFSIQNSSGIISGDDGKRYNFNSSEWKSDNNPVGGQIVDFSIDGENATSIYVEKNVVSGDKNKIVAAILAFFLGFFGVHKFYLGCKTAGIAMLLIFIFGMILFGFPSYIILIIAFVEAVIYLIKSDEEFGNTYVTNKKCWF